MRFVILLNPRACPYEPRSATRERPDSHRRLCWSLQTRAWRPTPGAKCVDSHCFANNCFALQTSRKRARKVTSALAAIHVKQLTNLRPQNSASFWESWSPDQIASRSLRACIGSTRDARQAGNMQATTPTSNNVSLTAAKTVGSRTSVLYSMLSSSRRRRHAGHQPGREPKERRPHSIHRHQPQHLFPLRTPSDANADFAGTLRGDIGRHAEQPRRHQQRNTGKAASSALS
jgi:hypothetical protein